MNVNLLHPVARLTAEPRNALRPRVHGVGTPPSSMHRFVHFKSREALFVN